MKPRATDVGRRREETHVQTASPPCPERQRTSHPGCLRWRGRRFRWQRRRIVILELIDLQFLVKFVLKLILVEQFVIVDIDVTKR